LFVSDVFLPRVSAHLERVASPFVILSDLLLLLTQRERDMIVDRVRSGPQAAKAKGVKLGRPIDHECRERTRLLYKKPTDMAARLGCSRQSVSRTIRQIA